MAVAVARQIETGQGSDTIHIGATAFLGVTVATASGGSGVIIVEVAAGSPADLAGLGPGDSIASFDAIPVDSAQTLSALLIPRHPGDQAAVSIVGREGRVRGVTVRLAAGPAA
jgi:S1-C subfamily serine protease